MKHEEIGPDPAKAQIRITDGRLFAPLAPDPDAFTPGNITRGMSNICRFSGQIGRFYSIAQHSPLVAVLATDPDMIAAAQDPGFVERIMGPGAELPEFDALAAQAFAILHDAEEAFALPDFASPIKPHFPKVCSVQDQQSSMIFERYGIDYRLKPYVKMADTMAYHIERRDLVVGTSEPVTPPAPFENIEVIPLQPDAAYEFISEAFEEIFDRGRVIDLDWMIDRGAFRIRAEPELEPCA